MIVLVVVFRIVNHSMEGSIEKSKECSTHH